MDLLILKKNEVYKLDTIKMTEYVMEEKRSPQNENRMLMMQGILFFLGIDQKNIEDSFFEKRKDFERKREYDYTKMKLNESELYHHIIHSNKNHSKSQDWNMKQPIQRSMSLFSDDTQSKSNVVIEKHDDEYIQKKRKKILMPSMESQPIQLYERLNEMFETVYGRNYEEYKMVRKNTKNRSMTYTFLESVLLGVNELFLMKREEERMLFVKKLIKKMHSEIYLEGNYQKFFYHRNRSFKKETLQMTMNQALMFRVEYDQFFILQQYVCDYLGMNLFIFYVTADDLIDFTKSTYFTTKQFEGVMNPYVPTLCFIYKKEVFYPIVHEKNEDMTVLRYSRDSEILETIWKYFDIYTTMKNRIQIIQNPPSEEVATLQLEGNAPSQTNNEEQMRIVNQVKTEKDLKKLKLEELQQVATYYQIELQKISEKTMKLIKKTKTELMEDLKSFVS